MDSDDATTQRVYDNLDASRALQAYLLGIPIVNQAAMRATLEEFGPVNQTDVVWEDLVDSKTVELAANDNSIYSFVWLDTARGPLVVEIPPMVPGLIDDFGFRWVADVALTGPDQGKGGKYLVLPPGYEGEVPEGCRSRTSEHLRKLDALPVLSRRRLDQARRRGHRGRPEDPPARRCGQSACDEARQRLRPALELRRPR